MNKVKTTVIIPCAGKGVRAELAKNKILYKLNGELNCAGDNSNCIFYRALSAFIDSGAIDEYIICASIEDIDFIKSSVPPFVKVVLGGDTRTQSIKNALALVDDGIVLIHDGARPFVSKRIILDCIQSVISYGSAVTAIPTRDTVLTATDGVINNYLGKSGLYQVQTPQAFYAKDIKKAYCLAGDKSFNDDGEVYKEYIGEVRLVLGEKANQKLTFKEDFEELDGALRHAVRFGVGFDCHRLVENRKLILGGVEIPHEKGLLGHSDADVLTHAIMDALLSACALRDIGYYFPDTDEKYKGANSLELLKQVLLLIKERGYAVSNVSAVIMAEKPKLAKHIYNIKQSLCAVLEISEGDLGVGATTLEGLGFVGREEGICVHATATIKKI